MCSGLESEISKRTYAYCILSGSSAAWQTHSLSGIAHKLHYFAFQSKAEAIRHSVSIVFKAPRSIHPPTSRQG